MTRLQLEELILLCDFNSPRDEWDKGLTIREAISKAIEENSLLSPSYGMYAGCKYEHQLQHLLNIEDAKACLELNWYLAYVVIEKELKENRILIDSVSPNNGESFFKCPARTRLEWVKWIKGYCDYAQFLMNKLPINRWCEEERKVSGANDFSDKFLDFHPTLFRLRAGNRITREEVVERHEKQWMSTRP